MLGAVVGKALEPLSLGTGVIQVLVTLQQQGPGDGTLAAKGWGGEKWAFV